MPNITRIPILLLTGFLGSGKTTFLQSLLRAPEAQDTAVIINEFGEVGLDHHLLSGASETISILENGCICCNLRDDLEATLDELFWRRLRREIPFFSRVIVETTGLAEPYRLLQLISENSFVSERFIWASVVSTVDGLTALETLDRHPEAIAQVMAADSLIITKTDLTPKANIERLEKELRMLNSAARIVRSSKETLSITIWDLFERGIGTNGSRVKRKPETPISSSHATHFQTFFIGFPQSLSRDEFIAIFEELRQNLGARLLRAKGILEFSEEDDVNIVQYVNGGTLDIASAKISKDKTQQFGVTVITFSLERAELSQILKGRAYRNGQICFG